MQSLLKGQGFRQLLTSNPLLNNAGRLRKNVSTGTPRTISCIRPGLKMDGKHSRVGNEGMSKLVRNNGKRRRSEWVRSREEGSIINSGGARTSLLVSRTQPSQHHQTRYYATQTDENQTQVPEKMKSSVLGSGDVRSGGVSAGNGVSGSGIAQPPPPPPQQQPAASNSINNYNSSNNASNAKNTIHQFRQETIREDGKLKQTASGSPSPSPPPPSSMTRHGSNWARRATLLSLLLLSALTGAVLVDQAAQWLEEEEKKGADEQQQQHYADGSSSPLLVNDQVKKWTKNLAYYVRQADAFLVDKVGQVDLHQVAEKLGINTGHANTTGHANPGHAKPTPNNKIIPNTKTTHTDSHSSMTSSPSSTTRPVNTEMDSEDKTRAAVVMAAFQDLQQSPSSSSSSSSTTTTSITDSNPLDSTISDSTTSSVHETTPVVDHPTTTPTTPTTSHNVVQQDPNIVRVPATSSSSTSPSFTSIVESPSSSDETVVTIHVEPTEATQDDLQHLQSTLQQQQQYQQQYQQQQYQHQLNHNDAVEVVESSSMDAAAQAVVEPSIIVEDGAAILNQQDDASGVENATTTTTTATEIMVSIPSSWLAALELTNQDLVEQLRHREEELLGLKKEMVGEREKEALRVVEIVRQYQTQLEGDGKQLKLDVSAQVDRDIQQLIARYESERDEQYAKAREEMEAFREKEVKERLNGVVLEQNEQHHHRLNLAHQLQARAQDLQAQLEHFEEQFKQQEALVGTLRAVVALEERVMDAPGQPFLVSLQLLYASSLHLPQLHSLISPLLSYHHPFRVAASKGYSPLDQLLSMWTNDVFKSARTASLAPPQANALQHVWAWAKDSLVPNSASSSSSSSSSSSASSLESSSLESSDLSTSESSTDPSLRDRTLLGEASELLQQRQLGACIEQLKQLQGPAKAVVQPWLKLAEETHLTQTTLRLLSHQASNLSYSPSSSNNHTKDPSL